MILVVYCTSQTALARFGINLSSKPIVSIATAKGVASDMYVPPMTGAVDVAALKLASRVQVAIIAAQKMISARARGCQTRGCYRETQTLQISVAQIEKVFS